MKKYLMIRKNIANDKYVEEKIPFDAPPDVMKDASKFSENITAIYRGDNPEPEIVTGAPTISNPDVSWLYFYDNILASVVKLESAPSEYHSHEYCSKSWPKAFTVMAPSRAGPCTQIEMSNRKKFDDDVYRDAIYCQLVGRPRDETPSRVGAIPDSC